MIELWRACRYLLPALLLAAACQPMRSADVPEAPVSDAAAKTARTAAPVPIDWQRAGDCRAMLARLHEGLKSGEIAELEGTPFTLIDRSVTPGDDVWSPVSSGNDLSEPAETRCILRISRAGEQQSEQRVLGRERVRSRYQNGTRSEKNPAYEVAKARLRQAEKAAKPGKSSIIKVGDPLIDLVGTLVGGALTGFGQWGAGDQLEEALDTLMETPPSIQQPKYASYHFERTRVRARREATLTAILTDRRLQRSWETRLRRREVRNLHVIEGLDPQDEHFARHRTESLTQDGLRQWLAASPPLPVEDAVAALLDRHDAAPFDRLALSEDEFPVPDASSDAAFREDEEFSLDAAALPFNADGDGASAGRRPSGGMSPGHVALTGGGTRAGAVYVAPHFILSVSDVVGGRSLVDIENRSGHPALGLVAAVDHGLGLALIHAPSPGQAVPIADRWSAAGSASGTLLPKAARHVGGPLLAGGRLVGFSTGRGPDIELGAIHAFLDQQRHLFNNQETHSGNL